MTSWCQRARALAVRRAAPTSGFNIDAEEADRLDLSLDVIEARARRPGARRLGRLRRRRPGLRPACRLRSSTGSTRWPRKLDRRLMVRLVKGAYWDTEIKRGAGAGAAGLSRCSPARPRPTSATRQCAAAARHARPDLSAIRHPQRPYRGGGAGDGRRATGSASSSSGCTAWARRCTRSCASERGHALPHLCAGRGARATCWPIWCAACSRTAPIRSFVNQIVDERVCRPRRSRRSDRGGRAPATGRQPGDPVAGRAFFAARAEFAGLRLTDPLDRGRDRGRARELAGTHRWIAGPMLAAGAGDGGRAAHDASTRPTGATSSATVAEAAASDVAAALAAAPAAPRLGGAACRGARRGAAARRRPLRGPRGRVLRARCAREAGKTLADAVAEVREAVDFLRYYAAEARPRPATARRAGCSSASRRGTFRWRSSPARSPPPWSPAMR